MPPSAPPSPPALLTLIVRKVIAADDEEKGRHTLIALFTLLMVVWSSLFVEGWKRRAKLVSLDWGISASGAEKMQAAMPLHVKFKEEAIKPGFYTEDGARLRCVSPIRFAPHTLHRRRAIASPSSTNEAGSWIIGWRASVLITPAQACGCILTPPRSRGRSSGVEGGADPCERRRASTVRRRTTAT